MQGFDSRVPASDGHERKPATARRRDRRCTHPRLRRGCVGERIPSALSKPRPVRASACNASRQFRERATPRRGRARHRGGRWVLFACSYRARIRPVSALYTVYGCRTAPWRGCGPLDGPHHCGNGCDGSAPYACVRDDAPRRTRNPVDAHGWCDHHGRRLPARLCPTTRQNGRFHGMRRYDSDETEQFDPSALQHHWEVSNSRLDWRHTDGNVRGRAVHSYCTTRYATHDNDWSPTSPQSKEGTFMTCSLEPSCQPERANPPAISAIRNRHSIDLNRGPWNTTDSTNGT